MINKLNIFNFKSIKNSSIKFPRFGAIVGKNAVGKTNLIQSIKFLKLLALGKTTIESQKYFSLTPNELFNFNENSKELSLEISLEANSSLLYQYTVKIGLINGSIKPPLLEINEEKLIKIKGENAYETIYTRTKQNTVDGNHSPIPLAVDSNKVMLSLYKNPDTEAVKEVFNNVVIPDINDLSSEGIGSTDPIKDDLASTIVRLHHNSPDTFNKFQIIVKKLMPNFLSVTEIPTKNAADPAKEDYFILFEEHNLKEKISMLSASGGDLRTLYLVALATSMQDNSTLFIEEIENGIHPKRIVDLIEHLETISVKKNAQIIFTTHHPIVINKLSPSEVVFTEKDDQKGTTFTLLDDSDQITNIKKLLEKGGKITDFLYSS